MKKIQSLLAFLLLICITTSASQKRKVLLIGIDGVRSDALQVANTPNLDSLIAHGSYTYDSWCLGMTISGPSWSSIFTGVWYQKHGVTNNTYSGSKFDKYHLFPALAKQHKPGLMAAEVVEWPPLIDEVPNIYDGYDVRVQVADGATTPTGTAAVAQLADTNVDILMVYYDQVDLTGHLSGYSPTNASYINAIQDVDANVGVVINALKARPNYANEDWLIMVITDHGGTFITHGGNTDEERHIWFIANGTHIAQKQLNIAAADPGTYRVTPPGVDTNVLRSVPVQTDVAVTALHFLLYDLPGIYPAIRTMDSLDGRSWLDTIYFPPSEPSITHAPTRDLKVKMYPNPATDLVTFWLDGCGPQVDWQVADAAGRIVKRDKTTMTGVKLNIDLHDLPGGSYVIKLSDGTGIATRKVVVQH